MKTTVAADVRRLHLSRIRQSLLTSAATLLCLLAPLQAEWQQALPGWEYQFPRDHGSHPGFKTEWWYFTGNLRDDKGYPFGYELTFFRQGLRSLSERQAGESDWIANEIGLAHFAVTDSRNQRFVFSHRLTRSALGLAGFGQGDRLAWIEDWSLRVGADGRWHLQAAADELKIDVTLEPLKPPVIHGENGVSQKSAGVGRASHYYSLSRMKTEGSLALRGEEAKVSGLTWFDHEWASNQLTKAQAGWDWFGLHLDDGRELMIYQLRLKQGGADPASSGTLVGLDGVATHLPKSAFKLVSGKTWTSQDTGVIYPLHWTIEIPSLDIRLEIVPKLSDQEMRVPPAAYWEGAVQVTGTTTGSGYMELTGYGGKVIGLTD